jgi:hypothetical protein
MTGLSERIAELREIAKDEGIAFSEKSLSSFMAFMDITKALPPGLFLHDDGNLNAIWVTGRQRTTIKFNGDEFLRCRTIMRESEE